MHRPELHDLSGLDKPVQDWVFAQENVRSWFEDLLNVLGPMVTAAEKQGNPLVTVALGCQGGHDRSVAIALGLAEAFELAGTRSLIRHLSFVRGPR
ncbi:RNase adapter RapZ [Saccharopolyspora sp. ASAGF58]|uniref:RapZ C-terminal domain-containing protein n=1 Tax=Saccharopolyspora sp. ASAGF58 TaxID=2719023 RepID=UPI0014482811|nr:RNase adapter RapZ [Saccharopolyspora sp. ASAGF58]